MLIRLASKKDYQQLLELLQLLNPDDPPLSAEHGLAVFDQISQSVNNQLWVMERKSALIGSVYLNIIPNLTRGAKPYAVIENVITDAAHRRQGIGKALMLHAIESAKQADCYKIMLLTGRDEKVQEFYSSCGFNKKGKQAFIYRFTD